MLLEAWKKADAIERKVWIDRLLEFNNVSNEIRRNYIKRMARAEKLGISYEEVLRRENERETRKFINELNSQRNLRVQNRRPECQQQQ